MVTRTNTEMTRTRSEQGDCLLSASVQTYLNPVRHDSNLCNECLAHAMPSIQTQLSS